MKILVSSEENDVVFEVEDRCLKVSEVGAHDSLVDHELLFHVVVVGWVKEFESFDEFVVGVGISLVSLHHWDASLRG